MGFLGDGSLGDGSRSGIGLDEIFCDRGREACWVVCSLEAEGFSVEGKSLAIFSITLGPLTGPGRTFPVELCLAGPRLPDQNLVLAASDGLPSVCKTRATRPGSPRFDKEEELRLGLKGLLDRGLPI